MSYDWKKELKEAKQMFDDGIITEEQFNEIRKSVLEQRKQISQPPTNKEIPSNPLASSPRTIVEQSSNILSRDSTIMEGVTNNSDFSERLKEGTRIGDYVIVCHLGEGGMGSVYRGRHHIQEFAEQGGDVAIKLMKPQLAKNPTFRSRFLREAGIGRRIQHVNIAQCLGVIDQGNNLGLVMSFIEGKELKEMIPEGGMSLEDVIRYSEPVAEALNYLHSQKIVHRDIKPENIKINQSGKPVILDLGIAKDLDSGKNSQTMTGTGMGTIPYMAPEQFTGAKSVDAKADQYALGMMIYELLTGQMPWESQTTEFDICTKKTNNDFIDICDVVSVEKHISKSLQKALHVNPVERFPSCLAFIQSLKAQEILDSSPSTSQEVGLSSTNTIISTEPKDTLVEAEVASKDVLVVASTSKDFKKIRKEPDIKITGVCSTIGRYFGINPTVVRILFVLASISTGGLAILIYIILTIVFKSKD